MINIRRIESDCQVLHHVFEFNPYLRHAYLERDNHLFHARESAKPFDPMLCFPWLEGKDNKGRNREGLRLDCELNESGNLVMEILPGLVEMLPYIDPSSIVFGIVLRKGADPRCIMWGDILLIYVTGELRENCEALILDDRLMIKFREVANPGELAEACEPEKPRGKAKPKKRKRLDVPPRDVVKYFRKEEPLIDWEPMLKGMYLVSWYDWVKKRRVYSSGVAWLAAWCGLSKRQVRRNLGRMKVRRVKEKKRTVVKGIVKLRGRGWPGEGCSRWELPCNMGLVMRWRRHLPKK